MVQVLGVHSPADAPLAAELRMSAVVEKMRFSLPPHAQRSSTSSRPKPETSTSLTLPHFSQRYS